jgi:Mg-chelatase subunit ChlD
VSKPVSASAKTPLVALALFVSGCANNPETVESTIQEVRSGRGGMIGVDVLITGEDGDAIPCGVGTLTVRAEASRDGGQYVPVSSRDVVVTCTGNGANAALVVDNSGSEKAHLDELQIASRGILQGVLANGGRSSLVRVSTNSTVVSQLTSDVSGLNAGIDSLHVAKGWTALYDGIRLGNETLGGVVQSVDDAATSTDVRAFCAAARKNAIVVFTDGRENNSAEENAATYDLSRYPGDGFATTRADLSKLRINNVTTPIYTVGLGRDVDAEALADLSDETGGRYLHTDSPAELPRLFDQVREYLGASHQVCVDLPLDECGDVNVRLSYDWTDGQRTIRRTAEQKVRLACPQKPRGKIATLVMTVSNPGISSSVAADLVRQAVDYVAPAAQSPKILVVRDDGHHNEFKDDPLYIQSMLRARGYSVAFTEEPRGGLTAAALRGYQVVWFSNPGYPMDDQRSFEALMEFSANGGGVVMQGDDITWSMGRSFSLTPMTQLKFVDNGTSACGTNIDNNRGLASYSVQFGAEPHLLLGPNAGGALSYGDDIDHTVAESRAEVLATGSYNRGTCSVVTPVLVGFDPLKLR